MERHITQNCQCAACVVLATKSNIQRRNNYVLVISFAIYDVRFIDRVICHDDRHQLNDIFCARFAEFSIAFGKISNVKRRLQLKWQCCFLFLEFVGDGVNDDFAISSLLFRCSRVQKLVAALFFGTLIIVRDCRHVNIVRPDNFGQCLRFGNGNYTHCE